jgi:hypothetical protein
VYQKYILSVVVPAYNEELLIDKNLISIMEYFDKIYAIYDGSYDNTFNIIKNISIKDNRIIPLQSARAAKSQIKYGRYLIKISWLLLGNFLYRLKMKHIYQDLSPIPFLFLFGALPMPLGLFSMLFDKIPLISRAMSLPITLLVLLLGLSAIILYIKNSREYRNR